MIISSEKDKFIINKDKTLNTALSLLNKNIFKCLIVLDNRNKLVGTLTDGDIRRLLLNGAIFVSKTKHFLKKADFFSSKTGFYLMPEKRSIDIDYKEDFKKLNSNERKRFN